MKKLDEAQIRRYAAEGLTTIQIAGRLGVSRTAIREYARRHSIVISPVVRDWWVKTNGMTDALLKERCKQLARELGVERTVTTIQEANHED